MSFNINKLKEILTDRKISQREIAKKISITQSGFNSMLANRDLKVSVLDRIADFLKVPVSYFFDEDCNNGVINNGGIQANGTSKISIKVNEQKNEIEKLKIQLESCQSKNKQSLELIDELRQRLIDKDELIELLKK